MRGGGKTGALGARVAEQLRTRGAGLDLERLAIVTRAGRPKARLSAINPNHNGGPTYSEFSLSAPMWADCWPPQVSQTTRSPKCAAKGSKSLSLCSKEYLDSMQRVAITVSIVLRTVMPSTLNLRKFCAA